MTDTTTTTRNALTDIKRRWLDVDPEPADPIEKLFWRRKLPADARLRQIYAAAQAAERQLLDTDQVIAEAEQELATIRARARQLKPTRYHFGAPRPTLAGMQELRQLGDLSEALQEWLAAQRQARESLAQQKALAEREWQAARERWAELVYHGTGDASFLAPGAFVVLANGSSAMERGSVKRQLEEIEK